MTYVDDLKKGFAAVFSPVEGTRNGMDVIKALRFYYEFSLLPFIAFIIVASIMAHFGAIMPSYVPFLSMLLYNPAFAEIAVIISAIVLFWIVTPIGFFINAAIYQVVGYNFLHAWKGDYAKTFSAVMFGSLPLLLFYWLVPVPILGVLALMVFAVWDIIVLVIALSNLQKLSRLAAIGVIFVSVAIVLVAVMILFALTTATLAPFTTLGSSGFYNNTFIPMMR